MLAGCVIGAIDQNCVKTRKGTGIFCRSPWNFSNLTGFGLLCGLRHWQDRNEGAVFESLVELHGAIGGCKDGVIFAHAYAFARPELGAALTHDDVACDGCLATIEFHAKAATR